MSVVAVAEADAGGAVATEVLVEAALVLTLLTLTFVFLGDSITGDDGLRDELLGCGVVGGDKIGGLTSTICVVIGC